MSRKSKSIKRSLTALLAAGLVGAICSGCLRHNEIDFTDRVIEVVATQKGRDPRGIESGTRLEEVDFDARDLDVLVTRMNEQASLNITVDDIKALSEAKPTWKHLRMHDIGCFVRSKVLDKRESSRHDADKGKEPHK
jgi:hypothetical protein